MAALYVVATPIGNLEDITLRALRVLKEVDLVLCEDTRVTKKLLAHYGISTPTLSYHARSGGAKVEKIIGLLEEGKNLALVSDAGTPTISDPGALLVSKIREYFRDAEGDEGDKGDQCRRCGAPWASERGDRREKCRHLNIRQFRQRVIAVPGPSALTAALSVAGVPASDFLFLGFLPHKKGRETLFREIGQSERTVVFYESPHRILKTLQSLQAVAGERRILLARELTKVYEEALAGTASELIERLTTDPQKQKGEFVVIVAPR